MPLIDTITTDEARQILNGLQDETAVVAKAYYDGDAWQDSDAWIGPRPAETDSDLTTVLDEIERGLISKNTIAEVTHRHRDALIGTEPDWSLTVRRPLKDGDKPTAQEQALIDEANAALVEWWDAREALTTFHEATANLLLSRSGTLRLFVPPILVSDNGTVPPFKDLPEALDSIYLHTPELFQSTVYIDPDTQEKLGVYLYQHRDSFDAPPENRLELQGLNGKKQTIIKIMNDAEELQATQPLDLGGHLAIFEMKRARFITQQVEQLTALVNMALTMMGRNVVLGGFLERILLNAQLPGAFIPNPADPTKTIFQPHPFYVGAGSTNALSGLPIYGDSQRPNQVTGFTNPSVVYRDPVPVDTFRDSLKEAYSAILEEVGQSHVLITKDATASGESRKQAAAEFVKTLSPTKGQVDAAGRWLLETALAMGSQFTGQAGRFAGLRAAFDSQIDLGPISSEEQNTAAMLVDKGIIDRTTAMVRVGVDDPDAEEAKLAEREKADFEQQQQLMAQKVKQGETDDKQGDPA